MTKKLLYVIAGISMLLGSPAFAENTAMISLSSAKTSYEVGQDIQVAVFVDPKNQTYDTAQAEIRFPAQLLELKSFSLNPLFSLASPDNGFDNAAGTASYGAGIPGGTDQKLLFGTATFKVKADGSAAVSLVGGSLVLAAGQNIAATSASSVQFSLAKPIVEPPAEPKPTTLAPASVVKKTQPAPIATQAEEGDEEKIEAESPTIKTVNPNEIPLAAAASESRASSNSNWFLALLVLFGSQATGFTHKESDVDVGYLSNKKFSFDDEAHFNADLIPVFKNMNISLVNLKMAPPLLLRQIVDNAVVLFERYPHIFVEIFLRAMRDYEEATPIFKLRETYLKRRIKEYQNA